MTKDQQTIKHLRIQTLKTETPPTTLDHTHLELVVQALDIVLDALYQLSLILSDGPSDVGTDQQGIVPGEDPEHLVGTLGSAQLVPESGSNPGLHTVYSLIIPG